MDCYKFYCDPWVSITQATLLLLSPVVQKLCGCKNVVFMSRTCVHSWTFFFVSKSLAGAYEVYSIIHPDRKSLEKENSIDVTCKPSCMLFGFHLIFRLIYIYIYTHTHTRIYTPPPPPKKKRYCVFACLWLVYVKYSRNILDIETGKEVRNKSIISNKGSVWYFAVLILSSHGYFHSLSCYPPLTKPDY
jgi:hypothetical protein